MVRLLKSANTDTVHLMDSTMLEADLGEPTVEDVMRRKQKEAEAKKEKAADETLNPFPVMSSAGLRKGEG